MFSSLDFVLLSFISLSFSQNTNESATEDLSTLKFVQVAWRGGLHAMEPGNPFKNLKNPYPEALGHLTKKGKRMMYEMGKFFKRRYGQLLNDTYDPFQVRFQSGDKNRTIESALLVAAGLFPPDGYQIWNPDLLWQPVPVHIHSKSSVTGAITLVLKKQCPSLSYILETKEYKSFEEHYANLTNFLCTKAITRENNFFYGFVTASVLYGLSYYNQSLWPDWATEKIVSESIKFYWAVEDFLYSYDDVIKLSSGWILDQMIGEMKDHVTGNVAERRFFAYSSHDDSLHGLMRTLNPSVNHSTWPPYGGFIAIELHQNSSSSDQHFVKVKFWTSADEEPETLLISDCESPCSLDNFESRSRRFISQNWDEDCGLTSATDSKKRTATKSSSDTTFTILVVACVVLGVMFLISLTGCLWTRHKLKKSDESRPILHEN